jgi:hypothetical protein
VTQMTRGRLARDWFEDDRLELVEREDHTWDVLLPVSTRVDVIDWPEVRVRGFLRRSPGDVARIFSTSAAEWEAGTAAEGNALAIVMHPAYQRIIGLGPQAVPLIIDALRTEVDHWFWALRAIVGEDKALGAASLSEAAQRWIEWYDSEHP